MSIEALLWGVIPAAVALVSAVLSVRCAARSRTSAQMFGAAVVILFTGYSLWLLKKIFVDGYWPVYLPHFLIAAAAIITVIQVRSVKSQKKEPNQTLEPTAPSGRGSP
jgi:hypothetical protein